MLIWYLHSGVYILLTFLFFFLPLFSSTLNETNVRTTHCAGMFPDLGAAYRTYRTSNYNGFRVATDRASINHFHCIDRDNDLSQLYSMLYVPIWRLNGVGTEWRMHRPSFFYEELYGEGIHRAGYENVAKHIQYYPSTDYNNNSELDYNWNLVAENGWLLDGTNVTQEYRANLAMSTPNMILSTIDSMYKLFCKMELDMNELIQSFTLVVDRIADEVDYINVAFLDDTFDN